MLSDDMFVKFAAPSSTTKDRTRTPQLHKALNKGCQAFRSRSSLQLYGSLTA